MAGQRGLWQPHPRTHSRRRRRRRVHDLHWRVRALHVRPQLQRGRCRRRHVGGGVRALHGGWHGRAPSAQQLKLHVHGVVPGPRAAAGSALCRRCHHHWQRQPHAVQERRHLLLCRRRWHRRTRLVVVANVKRPLAGALVRPHNHHGAAHRQADRLARPQQQRRAAPLLLRRLCANAARRRTGARAAAAAQKLPHQLWQQLTRQPRRALPRALRRRGRGAYTAARAGLR